MKKIIGGLREGKRQHRSTTALFLCAGTGQKVISAMTSGEVPDLFPPTPPKFVALFAWQGKLIDVSDIVETQKEQYTETACCSAQCYNNRENSEAFTAYQLPARPLIFHVWKSLVEKAGYKLATRPRLGMLFGISSSRCKTNYAPKASAASMASGMQISANGVDPNAFFNNFLIAYGGADIVTKDGRLHLDDAKVKEAVIKSLSYPAKTYKEGYCASGGDQLERRGRQQRVSFKADRDGPRRYDFDRGRHVCRQGRPTTIS